MSSRPEPRDDAVIRTRRTVLRPVADEDAFTLVAIRRSPEVARWWHAPDPGWPTADVGPGESRWTVELAGAREIGPDGSVIGLVQAYEGTDAEYAQAGIDLFLAGSVHRRGLGREVVGAVRDWLVRDRGHHRVAIDPATDNSAAIACYRACGFVPVGVMHAYEKDVTGDGWHDNLLMEYVVRR